jgi:hypothetical protein
MDNAKKIIDRLTIPTNDNESYDNFILLYNCFTPSEWLEIDIFFDIVNYIARKRPELVDLGTRINVQVNLYLRTIETYHANPSDVLNPRDIGCFALTESNAGVLSGLVVDVKFEETDNGYILNSYDCCKRWISQGIHANKGLVFASNKQNHRDCRIFLIDMKEPGVVRKRMDNIPITKIIDLAEIYFNDAKLPKTAVLEKTIPLSRKELLTGIFYGRVCLSEIVMNSISEFVEKVYDRVKDKDKFKKLPHLQYITNLNRELSEYTRRMTERRQMMLESKDIMKINCYKVYCVESAIQIYNKIHLMFGTHALGLGLEYQTLIFNKIAEGDSSVLKLACIKEYIDKVGIVKGLNYTHWFGVMRNPLEYILANSDKIFNEIVGTQIELLHFV